MGKSLIIQKRGKGGPAYKSPGHRFVSKAEYRRIDKPHMAEVIDFVLVKHDADNLVPELSQALHKVAANKATCPGYQHFLRRTLFWHGWHGDWVMGWFLYVL